MKLLVADIGGTNARFGYQKNKESEIEHIEFFNCVDFKNIDHAILHYISKNQLVVDNLSLSIAGPCEDNLIKFTNNHWFFKKNELLKKIGCNSLLAVNDFAAQGLGFTSFFKNNLNFLDKEVLKDHKLYLLKSGKIIDNSNVLITGPGTGLGVGTLLFHDNGLLPIQGEGGNVNFSPATKLEIDLLKWLADRMNYVPTEEVLSGRGLVNIYDYLVAKKKCVSQFSTAEEIGQAAINGDIISKDAAKLMIEIFATSIANNILITGSQKCVIICGGISVKLHDLFFESRFFERLRSKGRYQEYVDKVPILQSYDKNNGLKGAAEAFYNPFFKNKTF